MFDTARIRKLLDSRRPGHSLPQEFYTDPDIHEFDLARIYARSWIMVGFECEIPAPGHSYATTIGRTPIVITRDRDNILRAFHNSCRHRGAQICMPGRDKGPRLVCPYHNWTYDLQGRLVWARAMPDDFDRAENGLRPIAIETIAGTIYVCLSETPPPFQPFRDAFEPMLAPHELHKGKLAFEGTLVERANWKLVMENGRECYHCSTKHPELWNSFRDVSQIDYGRSAEEEPWMQAFRAKTASLGLGIGPVEGEWWQAQRFPLNEGCRSLTLDGKPAVACMLGQVGDGDIGSLRWALEPHTFCHATGDCVFFFSAMPTGPQETIVTSKWIVSADAVEGVDYDLEHLTSLWTQTNDQDRQLAENNQVGVNGLGYLPGPYSPRMEPWVIRFVDWYCEAARAGLEANA